MIFVSAALAATAIWLAYSRISPRGRLLPFFGSAVDAERGISPQTASALTSPQVQRLIAFLAAAVLAVSIGGFVGIVLGFGLCLALPCAFSRMESVSRREARRELVLAAPLVADLIGASLAAGATELRALPVISRAVGGLAGRELGEVASRIALGEISEQAWSKLSGTDGLGLIAAAVARSARSGAPLADLLSRVAEDLRAEAAEEALREVRALSVRAVLPLGLCLLPSFVMLGIVPIIAGLMPSF